MKQLRRIWRRIGLRVAVALTLAGVTAALTYDDPVSQRDAAPPSSGERGELSPLPGPGSSAPGTTPGNLDGTASTPPGGGPLDPGVEVTPYIDERFLMLGSRSLSFGIQPWRGYLETVPAATFLDGLGIGYNLPATAQHEAAVAALARAGFRSARLEVSWAQIGADDQLRPASRQQLRDVLGAFGRHGIRPLILLNANDANPGPHDTSRLEIRRSAPAGSRTIQVGDASKLVPGRSGLSDLERGSPMAAVLVTEVDGNEVGLSRPLPVDLPAGSSVRLDTLRYAPLHPVGHPAFDDTAAGWLRYVDAVLTEVEAAGFASYDVEVWNELTFGSAFLSVDNYHEPPVFGMDRGAGVRPGGPAWELARRTVEAVGGPHPGATVIWGFSNTDFFATPVADLPPGIGGQSYHPYHTQLTQVPEEFPAPDQRDRFDSIPRISMAMPEGRAHLAVQQARLPTLLHPAARHGQRPPRSPSFVHLITEHGFAPGRSGIEDEAAASAAKARSTLRALTFWLGRGVRRVEMSSAWKPDPLDNGLLPSTDPQQWTPGAADDLMTPSLTAVRNMASLMDGAVPMDSSRAISVGVRAFGQQWEAFPGLPYREMLVVQPFQIDADEFAVGVYVMGWNVLERLPAMTFELRLGGLDGRDATVERYADPIAGAEAPAQIVSRSEGDVTVRVEVTDSPRFLRLRAQPHGR